MNNKNYMNNKINSKIIYKINLSINRVHNNFRNVIGNGIKKYSTVSSFKDVEGNVNVNVNVNVNMNVDIKNISKYSLNKNVIDSNILNIFDKNFFNLVSYFCVFIKYISKKQKMELMNTIVMSLEVIGISKELIDCIVKYINNYSNKDELLLDDKGNVKVMKISNDRVEKLYYNIMESTKVRSININQELLENLLNVVNNILNLNIDQNLNSNILNILNDIEINCNNYGTQVYHRKVGGRKHPNRQVEFSQFYYEKYFNLVLSNGIKNINKVFMNWISIEYNLNVDEVVSITKIVNDIIINLNDSLAVLLFSLAKNNSNGLILINKDSLLSKFHKIDSETKNKFIMNYNRDIGVYSKIIDKIENTTSLDYSLDKISLNTPLVKLISYIFDSNISIEDKQIALEKALIEYELDFLAKNTDNPNTRLKLLHEIYPKLKAGYDKIIYDYSSNNYNMLIKKINIIKDCNWDVNNKDFYSTIVILIIMYLGAEKCISFTFAQLINLLTDSIENHKKTNIVFTLGTRVIRLIKFLKLNENKKLNKIIPLTVLKEKLSTQDQIGLYHLGDTLLHIITDNCDIIKEELIKDAAHDTHIVLKINDKFASELSVGAINLLQLPMLTEPRKIQGNGIYLPYINSLTTNLYLFEGSLIKNKYNQKFKTKGNLNLYNSINYLNSMKFKINKTMLEFILLEWNNPKSILFNGHNVYQQILDTDTKEIKFNKRSSNSKYNMYSNIITIANLYKNTEFYLPVFVDFRGRVYPLSSYISYQAGDIGRSLLLFADIYAEKLNKTGIECLNIYLANLAGYDKLPWNKRLAKIDGIVNEFLDSGPEYSDWVKYIEQNIKKISEPFQFISTMIAKIATLNNPDIPISNPILFDASCSGLQHIASLTLEQELARNVNVFTNSKKPSNDYPQDFYLYALGKIKEKLLLSDIETLRDIKLDRKMIKRSVMTIPYNISLTGIGEHLMEHFQETWVLNYRYIIIPGQATYSGKSLCLTPQQFGQLTKIVYFVLTKELPSLKSLGEYFDKMLDIFIDLGLPITWITPPGLKIKYTNIKFESKKIKAKILKTSKIATIRLPTDSVDKLAMKRSFMPNFIHSLDAANVHILISSMSTKSLPVFTVHDCFASTPNNMNILVTLVKTAFIDIYFTDEGYLLKIHKHFTQTIKSATESYIPIGLNDTGEISTLSTIENNSTNTDINYNSNEIDDKVINTHSQKLIKIPSLPIGYMERNNKLNDFIKGLFKSKYFIG